MEFQAKLFSWQDTGNHLFVIARGAMDGPDLTRLFGKIRAQTQSLSECKVLVDLSDGTCQVDVDEIERLVAGLDLEGWAAGNRIALLSAPEIIDYHRLYFLRTAVAGRGLVVGVFRNLEAALDWLAGRT